MPVDGSTIKFDHMYNKEWKPFAIYLDFEAAPVPVEDDLVLGKKTTVKANHQVASYCVHVVSRVPGINIEPVLYGGPNAVENLLDNLKMLEDRTEQILQHEQTHEPDRSRQGGLHMCDPLQIL